MFALIFSYLKRKKWLYILGVICLIIYDFSVVLPTQIIQRLIDAVSSQSLSREGLFQQVFILLVLVVVNYSTAFIWTNILFRSSNRFRVELQQKQFKKILGMRRPFFEKFRSGDMLTRFSSDIESIQELVGYGLMIIFYGGGMVVFVIPTMLLISWSVSLLALLPLFVLTGSIYMMGRRLDSMVEANRDAVGELNNEVLEVVDGIRVMRAYARKKEMAQKFQAKTEELLKSSDRLAKIQSLFGPLFTICLALSTVIVLIIGASQVQQGKMTLGQVLALQMYIFLMIEPFGMFSDLILTYQNGKTSFKKVNEVLQTSDDIEADGTRSIDKIESLSFSHYSFQYPNSERLVLSDISFELMSGQTLGIVGPTGSGKSTLVKQLLRQYHLGSGLILVNGFNITDYSRKSFESVIGYVPQEHTLFSKTIAENIAMGGQEVSYEDLERVVETAAFSEDLSRMANGFETQIGENGISISGGQKQRISIARAFVRRPDVLILDDSLSAVDAKTERHIIQNIQEKRRGKTTLIVTHRLSAVAHADLVLVLKEGRIVESGRPDELITCKGWYQEQYQQQQLQDKEVN